MKEEEREIPEPPVLTLPPKDERPESKEANVSASSPSHDSKNPKDEQPKKKTVRARVIYKELLGKDSDEYLAATIGDQVGDPMKATSGPAISELMKQSCMIALIFGEFFASIALVKV